MNLFVIISITTFIILNAFKFQRNKICFSSYTRLGLASNSNSGKDLSDSIRLSDEERLQKVISRAGIASRRKAETLILDGRVVVNGKIVTELGTKVKPRKDIIIVDGLKLQLPDPSSIYWLIYYKPRDVLSTLSDSKDRATISNSIPKAKELRLLPVDRLEREHSGLLILTNEIGWIHPLTHPSFSHKKRYQLIVNGLPTEEKLEALNSKKSISSDLGNVTPSNINIIDQDIKCNVTILDVSFDESNSDQIQKILSSINCDLVRLKRLEFGPLKLTGLRKGQWRELSPSEITNLKKSCKSSEKLNTSKVK